MSAPAGIPFECPRHTPIHTWWAWVRMVRSKERQPTREDLAAYLESTGGKMSKAQADCDKPRHRHFASARKLGRKEFRAFVARIEAGRCDPRFVVGVDAIMWDASRGVKA